MKYRKVTTVLFIVTAIISTFLLIRYWDVPDEREIKTREGSFSFEIRYTPVAEITSPTVIFGDRDTIREEPFFTDLVKKFWLEYEIKTSPNIKGDYSIKTYLKPSQSKILPEWRKELPYTYEGVIDGQEAGKLPIDIFYAKQLWDRIKKETGLNYNTPVIEIETRVNVLGEINGEKIKREYRHISSITIGKTMKFSNLVFTKSENVEKNTVLQNHISTPVGQAKPSTLRYILAALTTTSILAIAVLNRKTLIMRVNTKINSGSADRKFRKKYGSSIIQARKISLPPENTVFLKTPDDVGKIAYELESPIMETEEYLAVMSNGSVYAYVKGGGNEKKK